MCELLLDLRPGGRVHLIEFAGADPKGGALGWLYSYKGILTEA